MFESKHTLLTIAHSSSVYQGLPGMDCKRYIWVQNLLVFPGQLSNIKLNRDHSMSNYLSCLPTTIVSLSLLTFHWMHCSWSISAETPPQWWTSSSRRMRRWVPGVVSAEEYWLAWELCSTAGCSDSLCSRSTRGPRSLWARLKYDSAFNPQWRRIINITLKLDR